jgi:hypothetical protein
MTPVVSGSMAAGSGRRVVSPCSAVMTPEPMRTVPPCSAVAGFQARLFAEMKTWLGESLPGRRRRVR